MQLESFSLFGREARAARVVFACIFVVLPLVMFVADSAISLLTDTPMRPGAWNGLIPAVGLGALLCTLVYRDARTMRLWISDEGLKETSALGPAKRVLWGDIRSVRIKRHRASFSRAQARVLIVEGTKGIRIAIPCEIEGIDRITALLKEHVPDAMSPDIVGSVSKEGDAESYEHQ